MGVSLTVAFKTSLNDNEDEHQDHGILREPQIRIAREILLRVLYCPDQAEEPGAGPGCAGPVASQWAEGRGLLGLGCRFEYG